MKLQKITPFLWFDGQAEEAAAFYLSVFPNSRPGPVVRNTGAAPGRAGDVLVAPSNWRG
jgi:predicted 3-demethylubiquinone-9 3-methyltransferase (glyoxalase superfamily)